MVGIYKIESPSGKVYIGQSWNIEDRFRRYMNMKCKTQTKLYSSLLSYGSLNHVFTIVNQLPYDISQEVLDNYETLYLSQYKEVGKEVLNIREAGSNGKLSSETIEKIKNRDHSYKIGRKQSPETIEKRVSKTRGRKHSEETKRKMSEARKGIIFTDEHRLHISIAVKNCSVETREKYRKARLGKKMSEETKFKISEKIKNSWDKRRQSCA